MADSETGGCGSQVNSGKKNPACKPQYHQVPRDSQPEETLPF